ncbi:MAG TPA: energy transducer TonB, partial [Acidobacteriaceae bacterium]|nr:energy transducer TonB [Acidobacteriaceae bacterium]
LWANVRDVFFPAKLPPLVLDSKPIPVVDRMATRQDPKATATALALWGLVVLLLFWWGARKMQQIHTLNPLQVASVIAPPPMPVAKSTMAGGGGQRGPAPVAKGRLPKFAATQITPPKAPPLEPPKIRMPDPTIEVQKDLKMADNHMPNFGMPNSPVIGTSLGNGRNGTGIGPGDGPGAGPGSGGNCCDGIKQIGGGVSQPIPLVTPEPEFSEEARRSKTTGVVTVEMIVDTHGRPQNVSLVRGVGMGLDEKAIAAVRMYKFKPAMEDGKPVPVRMDVQVTFNIE